MRTVVVCIQAERLDQVIASDAGEPVNEPLFFIFTVFPLLFFGSTDLLHAF